MDLRKFMSPIEAYIVNEMKMCQVFSAEKEARILDF